jgi:hypothetical protein
MTNNQNACPVCGKAATEIAGRHVHNDGSANIACWRAQQRWSDDPSITTGQTDPEAVWVTPQEIQYVYLQEGGDDWLALSITDPRLGPVLVTLAPDGAAHVARSLTRMLRNLPSLRSEWSEANGGQS